MLFFTSVDDPEKYWKILIDGKVFYEPITSTKPRRRYSDKFKDPGFIAREKCRKIEVLRRNETSELEQRIERMKEGIRKCVEIMNESSGKSIEEIYNTFGLKRFNLSDNESESDES